MKSDMGTVTPMKLLVKSTLIWICGLVFAHFANVWSFTPTVNLPENALPDVIHKWTTFEDGSQWIDHSSPSSPWYGICDLMLMPQLLLFVLCLLQSHYASRVLIISELMRIHAVLFVLRGVLINVTTLPSPVKECHNSNTMPENLFISIYCNDQIFSGHTTTNLLFCLFACSSPHLSDAVRVFALLIVVLASFLSIVSRDHYTVDVLLAWTHACGAVYIRRESILGKWKLKEE